MANVSKRSSRRERRSTRREKRAAPPTLLPTTFHADHLDLLRADLKRRGFTNYEAFDGSTLEVRYYDALQRLIPPRPRTVRYVAGFHMPTETAANSAGFDRLVRRIARGHDLSAYLSRTTVLNLDPKVYDGLLLDWQVHHLHLGEKIDPKNGLIKGTEHVLFANFTDTDAFLICIQDHRAWARDEVAEAICAELPHLAHEVPGMIGWASNVDKPTEQERAQARKLGWLTPFQAKTGKMYYIGHGYSTARTSMRALRMADAMRAKIADLEKDVPRAFPQMCEAAKARGIALPRQVRIRFHGHDQNGYYLKADGVAFTWRIRLNDDHHAGGRAALISPAAT